jgi:uncharacterized protein (TIGR00106 family)
MVVAELSIIPVGEGTSERRYVEAAIEALRAMGLRPEVGPLGTALQADRLDDVLEAVRAAHRAVMDLGAQRVLVELRVDDRVDERETIEALRTV